MVMQFKQGFFCTLKTATVIFGMLGISSGLFMVAATVYDYNPRPIDSMKYIDASACHVDGREHEENFAKIMKVIMGLTEIIISTALIVGAVTERPKLVYPWVVLNVLQNVCGSIVIFTLAIYVTIIGNSYDGVLLVFVLTINALLQGYMILVVNSYHTTLLTPPAYDYSVKKGSILYA